MKTNKIIVFLLAVGSLSIVIFNNLIDTINKIFLEGLTYYKIIALLFCILGATAYIVYNLEKR